MNAAMMNIKLQNFEASLEQLKFAKQFFNGQDNTQDKLNYRIAVSLNGLGRYKEAIEVLKPLLEMKDPLVKVEYNKAVKFLKEENAITDDQKGTLTTLHLCRLTR